MAIKSTIALIDRGSEAAYFLPPKVISLVLQNGSWILGAQRRVVLSDGCEELGFAFTKPSIYCIGCCREGQPEPPGSTRCSMPSTSPIPN